MKIIHKARRNRKTTTDIINAAFEKQANGLHSSVIVTSNEQSKKYIEDTISYQCQHFQKPPQIDVVLFKDLPEYLIERHTRNIYIDDLDLCLEQYAGKEINMASIGYDEPCYDGINLLIEEDGEKRCPGRLISMTTRLRTECKYCPYQYKHPFDEYWIEKEVET